MLPIVSREHRMASCIHSRETRATPNDPKLSDGGGWRDGCAGEGGGAASVTAGAVRCSAWLGLGILWHIPTSNKLAVRMILRKPRLHVEEISPELPVGKLGEVGVLIQKLNGIVLTSSIPNITISYRFRFHKCVVPGIISSRRSKGQ